MAQGVYTLRGLGVGLILAGAANAQVDPGMVWRHQSAVNESWIPTSVSLAKHGSEVFSQFGGYGQTARLISGYAADPAPAEWMVSGPYYAEFAKVDSAQDADVHASWLIKRDFFNDSFRPMVSKFTSSSAQADWSWTFPFTVISGRGDVHVASEGDTIVAWAHNPFANSVGIAIFSDGSNEPSSYQTWTSWGAATGGAISGDGTTFVLNGGRRTAVFDLESGGMIWQSTIGTDNGFALAVSDDGTKFARSLVMQDVEVFERQGANFVKTYTHTLAGAACSDLDLVKEGQRLFMGYNYANPSLLTSLRVVDLTGTPSVMYSTEITATGSYNLGTLDLDASSSGHCFAVGLTGDQFGLVPELQVYSEVGGSYQLTFSENLPGSVFDVDLSMDGKRVATASKSTHEVVFSNGGQIDLFDIEPRDIRVNGVPNVGSTITLEQHVGSGRHAITLASTKRARDPLAIGNVGVLYLDRNALSSVGNGTAGNDGIVTKAIEIPNNVALIGTKQFYQTLMTGPRRLSEDWVCVTVLP